MIKKSLLLAAAALTTAGLSAATLTPEQALSRAKSSPEGRKLAKISTAPVLTFTAYDKLQEPAVYLFNQADNGGIILVAADDVAAPILGYTDEGNVDGANLPEGLEYWLEEYASQISFAKSRGAKAFDVKECAYPTDWTYVAPRVKSQWNQDAPYNALTPTFGNSHAPTGCVATAMAQVMYYWKYPEIGTGSITYNMNGTNMFMSFNRQPFEWDKMLDRYVSGQYTSEQADAVAYLMKACGYSTEMAYRSSASGTPCVKSGIAMMEYFGYDGNMKTSLRCLYNDAQWTSMVYDQIKNVGPVIYYGDSPEGAHAFIVDGYDGNGFFHINWGWGGTGNGFYLLTALNNMQQGSGGAFGGFNTDQAMIYDIQKPTGQPVAPQVGELTLFGNLNCKINSSALSATLTGWNIKGYANMSLASVTLTLGFEIQKADGSGSPIYEAASNSTYIVTPGAYIDSEIYMPTIRIPSSLESGRYKVSIVFQRKGSSNWEHLNVPIGYFDYVYLTKLGTSYAVENLSPLRIKLDKAEIKTPLYYNNPCLVEMTISNPTDMELTQMVRPTLLIDGKINFAGDTYLVSVEPGKTVTRQFNTTFYRQEGGKVPSTVSPVDFQLSAQDFNALIDYDVFGTYTMYRASSGLKVNLLGMEISNAGEVTEEGSEGKVYGINDPSDIDLKVSFEVGGNGTYLASPLTAVISEYDAATQKTGAQVYEKDFPNYVYMASGETGSAEVSLNFDEFDPAKMYSLGVYYLSGTTRVSLGAIKFAASSGVESIVDESSLYLSHNNGLIMASSESGVVSLSLYDLGGATVASSYGSGETQLVLPVENLGKGIYIVKATDSAGQSKTLKITK